MREAYDKIAAGLEDAIVAHARVRDFDQEIINARTAMHEATRQDNSFMALRSQMRMFKLIEERDALVASIGLPTEFPHA